MPWVKISSEAHKAMKQFLVDIEGLTLGELVQAAFEYAMQDPSEFDKFLDLEEVDEDDIDGELEDEDDSEEEQTASTDKTKTAASRRSGLSNAIENFADELLHTVKKRVEKPQEMRPKAELLSPAVFGLDPDPADEEDSEEEGES